MTLIERAERAATREEAVAVFKDYLAGLAPATPPANFLWFYDDAVSSGNDTTTLGYLLLAAMAVVPEGLGVNMDILEDRRAGVILLPDSDAEFPSDYCHFPCTALLAAILKADEAQDDR